MNTSMLSRILVPLILLSMLISVQGTAGFTNADLSPLLNYSNPNGLTWVSYNAAENTTCWDLGAISKWQYLGGLFARSTISVDPTARTLLAHVEISIASCETAPVGIIDITLNVLEQQNHATYTLLELNITQFSVQIKNPAALNALQSAYPTCALQIYQITTNLEDTGCGNWIANRTICPLRYVAYTLNGTNGTASPILQFATFFDQINVTTGCSVGQAATSFENMTTYKIQTDFVAPTCYTQLRSTNLNRNYAAVGDNITITFSCDVAVRVAGASLLRSLATPTLNGSIVISQGGYSYATVWQWTITLAANDIRGVLNQRVYIQQVRPINGYKTFDVGPDVLSTNPNAYNPNANNQTGPQITFADQIPIFLDINVYPGDTSATVHFVTPPIIGLGSSLMSVDVRNFQLDDDLSKAYALFGYNQSFPISSSTDPSTSPGLVQGVDYQYLKPLSYASEFISSPAQSATITVRSNAPNGQVYIRIGGVRDNVGQLYSQDVTSPTVTFFKIDAVPLVTSITFPVLQNFQYLATKFIMILTCSAPTTVSYWLTRGDKSSSTNLQLENTFRNNVSAFYATSGVTSVTCGVNPGDSNSQVTLTPGVNNTFLKDTAYTIFYTALGSATVSAASFITPDEYSCFPAGEVAAKVDGSSVAMKDLQIGDQIWSADEDGHLAATEVVFIRMHRSSRDRYPFLTVHYEFEVESGSIERGSLSLTPNHMVYVDASDHSPIAAHSVKPGDVVFVFDKSSLTIVRGRVTAIDVLFSPVAYSVITMNGKLIVGNALASSYGNLGVSLAHFVHGWHRLWYTVHPSIVRSAFFHWFDEFAIEAWSKSKVVRNAVVFAHS